MIWLSTCLNFPERPTETELAANKPLLPEIEHLKGKISDKELDFAQGGSKSERRRFFET